MVDNYPVVSQVKSLIQWASGDSEGALQTQDNFLNETPLVGDYVYFCKKLAGDKSADETRRRCNEGWSKAANSTPGVGHAKGVYHAAMGEDKEAFAAFNSANRSSFMALAAATTGGLSVIPTAYAFDTCESLYFGQERGLIDTTSRALNDPSAGNVCDAIGSPGIMMLPSTNPVKIGTKHATRYATRYYE